MGTAYIALGSNIGDRKASLRQAVDRMAELGTITKRSSIYETDPVGYFDQPAFLNAVLELETSLEPVELLAKLHQIEHDLGRERSFRNAPRTIDLDLLLFDDLVLTSDQLTIPHPRMHERAFVLVPLSEIAPEVVVPRATRSARELLGELPGNQGVQLWGEL
jgi:2-amino-4-hydroxy-6-hydroxymethyldihydropteridine diphosphokinase